MALRLVPSTAPPARRPWRPLHCHDGASGFLHLHRGNSRGCDLAGDLERPSILRRCVPGFRVCSVYSVHSPIGSGPSPHAGQVTGPAGSCGSLGSCSRPHHRAWTRARCLSPKSSCLSVFLRKEGEAELTSRLSAPCGGGAVPSVSGHWSECAAHSRVWETKPLQLEVSSRKSVACFSEQTHAP